MDIHDAIIELQLGNPIYRKSDEKKRLYYCVVNEKMGKKFYGETTVDDSGDDDYFSVCPTETFSIEEIRATDWEVYKPISGQKIFEEEEQDI